MADSTRRQGDPSVDPQDATTNQESIEGGRALGGIAAGVPDSELVVGFGRPPIRPGIGVPGVTPPIIEPPSGDPPGTTTTPAIVSRTPASAAPGSTFTLTINGSNLSNASAIVFAPSSGISAGPITRTATQVAATITINASAASGARTIAVTTPNGTSNTLPFTIGGGVGANPIPIVTGINPSSVPANSAGVQLNVTGSNFVFGAMVKIEGESRPTTFIDSSRLIVQLSSADTAVPGPKTVRVVNPPPGGGTSVLVGFIVTGIPQSGPPAAPSNLVAAPLSATRIRLQWQDNSNDEQGFNVRRKGPFDADFVTIATVAPNVTSFTDNSVLPDTTYAYRIRAFKGNDGSSSNEASATTFSGIATGF